MSSEGRGEKMEEEEEEGNSIAYADFLTLKASHKPLASTFQILPFMNQNYAIHVSFSFIRCFNLH